ncbi:MAG: hypothetical protein L0332_16110 [Chloroflexi bacterium]|nr:hypothetical protein [Chloroflexota bacterium]MCI0643840.1 hypothetical protein [Chloroflexota bacterium]MCI0728226.1 hypothetical protein [Chloroflexota bacterium]
MRGCSRLLALLMALLFVATAVPVFFLYNLAQVITDREAVKQALNGEELLSEVATAMVRQELENQPGVRDLPAVVRESEALQAALDNLLPPGWAASQTDAVVDAIFNYLETGDEAALVVTVDTGPLVEALRGEAGRQLVLAVLTSLPPCTTELPNIDLATGQIDIPGCLPQFIPVDLLATQLHATVVLVIDSSGGTLGSQVLQFNLLDPNIPGTAEARQTLQRLRQIYLVSERWSWLLWLAPLVCLALVFLLGVRSPGGFGHWLGWPILATGGLSLFLAWFSPYLFDYGLRVAPPLQQEGAVLLVGRFVRAAVEALMAIWLQRVMLQGALTFIAGLFLVGLGFIAGWMLAEVGPGAGSAREWEYR